jgi:peptidylprolyl isomerase
MVRVLALLAALVSAAPAFAQQLPAGTDPPSTILIDTKYGRIVIKLRDDIAPRHTERIKQLARERYYDNVPFHRVIPRFMAQTGDGARGDGSGGSKYPNLAQELSDVPFKRGTVGMARANDPSSANSQFFIMLADGASLDGKYTVVGEVVAGMDVVDRIKTGAPVEDPDRMLRVRVAPSSVKELFENFDLIGSFAVDCSLPASAQNQYVVHRLNGDYVQRDTMTGPVTRSEASLIDSASESGSSEVELSMANERGRVNAALRIESHRWRLMESTRENGEKLVSGGRATGGAREELPWLNKCG